MKYNVTYVFKGKDNGWFDNKWRNLGNTLSVGIIFQDYKLCW